ncbi:tandem-95 repeat protein, partial [Aquimonas voraii]
MTDQHPMPRGVPPATPSGSRWLPLGSLFGLLFAAGAASAAAPVFINSPGNQTMAEDGTLNVTAEVFDADGDPIALSAVSGNQTIIPNNRITVSPVSAGNGVRTITIQPAPNQNGSPTQITLTALANGETVQALFTVTVSSVNDAPVTAADSYSAVEDTPFTASTSVLANDSDLQGGAPGENNLPMTAVLGTGPSNAASFTLNSDGTFSYTPAANFNGTDSFTYRARDSLGAESALTTVTLSVSEVNDAPVATDDSIGAIAEDSGDYIIDFVDLLANDNPGGAGTEAAQTLNITAVNSAVGGTVNIVGSEVVFSPTLNFNGAASFVYTVTDNGTTNGGADPLTDTATVSFTVTEVNDAPVAVDDTPAGTYLEEATQYVFTAASLLANDNAGPEEGSQTITIDSVGAAVGGSVSLVGTDPVFVPAANFNGAASFTYTIIDNGTTNGAPDVLTDTATVSFEITA